MIQIPTLLLGLGSSWAVSRCSSSNVESFLLTQHCWPLQDHSIRDMGIEKGSCDDMTPNQCESLCQGHAYYALQASVPFHAPVRGSNVYLLFAARQRMQMCRRQVEAPLQ